MDRCSYHVQYADYQMDKVRDYWCPNQAYSDGLCKYHRPSPSKELQQEISASLLKYIEEAGSDEPLYFIGYYFPEMRFKHFMGPVYFLNAHFTGRVDFSGAEFKDFVDFTGAVFEDTAIFDAAIFERRTIFSVANFKKDTSFVKCGFNGVIFHLCSFEKDVSFDECTSNGELDVSDTSFNGSAQFQEASFLNDCVFLNSQFKNSCSFVKSYFKGDVIFRALNFAGITSFEQCTFESPVAFIRVSFEMQEKTFFNGNLSKCSFLGTEITRVRFNENTIWNDHLSEDERKEDLKEEIRWIFEGKGFSFADKLRFRMQFIVRQSPDGSLLRRASEKIQAINQWRIDARRSRLEKSIKTDYKIYDEHLLEYFSRLYSKYGYYNSEMMSENSKVMIKTTKETEFHGSLESVIAEYRNLRENYEYNMKYEEAGKFFVREMEIRRKFYQAHPSAPIKGRNWLARTFSPAGLYYYLAEYGESYTRLGAVVSVVFLLGTFYFWDGKSILDSIFQGHVYSPKIFSLRWPPREILEAFSKTIVAFFPAFSLPAQPSFPEVALRAIMLPLTGLTFITLRRKLERRFRH